MNNYLTILNHIKIFLITIFFFIIYSINVFGQWIQQPFPYSESLSKVRFFDSTKGWILGENHIFKTSDAGNTWVPQDSSGGFGISLTVINANTVLYSSLFGTPAYGGMIRKTTNGGSSWQTVDTLSFYCGKIQFLNDQLGYAGGGSLPGWHPTLRKTTNGGSTWTTVWSDITNYEIRGLHFISSDTGWVVLYDAVIMKTTNGGINWTKIDSIGPYSNLSLPLRDITFATPDSGWAVGGISGDAIVVRTTDAGSHWSYNDFNGSSLREVKFLNSKIGWICGAYNAFPFIAKSTNGGETWITQYQDPYSPLGIESISMIDTNLGWAVSSDGKVYKTTNGGVSFANEEVNNEIPNEFQLMQNFPNPFNPSTKIKYFICETAYVVLNIFDVLGNEIATLIKEEKPSGRYEVNFDGSNLPSGIYFYQLNAGKYSVTKKMVLIR